MVLDESLVSGSEEKSGPSLTPSRFSLATSTTSEGTSLTAPTSLSSGWIGATPACSIPASSMQAR